MFEHDALISEYEHDKFRPREAEALKTLRKVASLVKPIMRQRGWRVGVLTEFWPAEKNLLGLNWNKGQKICLRLRYPYDEKQFLPIEDVVDTMLHELCHIVHGPHDEAFHNLWNQLRNEHEQLVRKGYTGEGFLSNGHKLGGNHIPMDEARRRARAAAEKRRVLTAGSGQKLGGARARPSQDIRRVIADAATRRLTVTKGCASGTEREKGMVDETTRTGFRTKAKEEDADEQAVMQAYIEMIREEEREKYGKDYIQASSENPAGSSRTRPIVVEPEDEHPSFSTRRSPQTGQRTPIIPADSNPQRLSITSPLPTGPPDSWTCDICTLSNPLTYLCCDACSTERPSAFLASSPFPEPLPRSNQQRLPHAASSNFASKGKNRSLKSLAALTAVESKKPLGWTCHSCGNWMENQWWTCAGCGSMKLTS